jgi:hypothetical protein
MEQRITPDNITDLKDNEVFVFGSNESGFHGAGAALMAKMKWGARERQGFGMVGQTFAIPTKDWDIEVLPLPEIWDYVDRFLAFADSRPELNFMVTQIGCGLAGYTPAHIAPMFTDAMSMSNVWLPKEFIDVIRLQVREHGKTEQSSKSKEEATEKGEKELESLRNGEGI